MAFFLNPLLKLMFQKKTDGGGGGPCVIPIHYVDGSSILNNALGNIDTTGWNVNDIVVVGNMTASTYSYVTSGNVSKSFTGSPDYDLSFRYCGNSKYNSLNVSLIA